MRKRLLLSAILSAVLLSVNVYGYRQQRSEDWRKTAPGAGPLRPFKLPDVHESVLDNGLRLIVVQDDRAPIATIDIAIPAGEIRDPSGQPGLAEATANLLSEGAGGLSSNELSRKVELLGGRLNSGSNSDFAEISVSSISSVVGQMIGLAADVLLRPDFPEKEVELYKKNRVENLTVQRQDPSFLVSEQFDKIVYGSHPYSISAPTPEAVGALNRALIEKFYKTYYSPSGSVLIIAGNFDWKQVEQAARTAFGNWHGTEASKKELPAPPARSSRQVFLIDRPGSAQANVYIGNLAVARSSKDYIPLTVANAILGAGTGSRLFQDVREQKGYTYDVSSSVSALREYGTFLGSTETRTEVAGAAIQAILADFDRMRDEKVPDDDLQHAKNFLTGNFSLALSTEGSLASQLILARLYGLGSDYVETYRSKVDAVTADQVQEIAKKYISTKECVIVVVGDAAKLKPQLDPISPVVMIH